MLRALAPLVNLFAAACAQHSALPRTTAFVLGRGVRSRAESLSSVASTTLLGTCEARLRRHSSSIPPGMSSLSSGAEGGGGHDSAGTDLPFRYRWPRPAVTVDCLIYTLDEGKPWILLINRKNAPFQGSWALPGGFVDENEGLDAAARRELEEETGVTDCEMVQTGAYGDPGRDPRGHTITVAFMAWAPSRASCNARAGDDAAEASFFAVDRLPSMAFDHLKVITDSWARCRFGQTNDGGGETVTVQDTASGQTLAKFKYPNSSSSGAAVAGALSSLVAAEGRY